MSGEQRRLRPRGPDGAYIDTGNTVAPGSVIEPKTVAAEIKTDAVVADAATKTGATANDSTPQGGAPLPTETPDAPPIAAEADADPVAAGRAAWERRKAECKHREADDQKSLDDWLLIGEALMVGRRETLAKVKRTKSTGRKFSEHYHNWLQLHGFDDIAKSDRRDLLAIIDKRAEVEAYLNSLPEAKRAQLNHPTTVWRAYICPKRGNRGKPKDQTEDDTGTDAANEGERDLLLRAGNIISLADFTGPWPLDLPPSDGLLSRWKKAADSLADVVRWMECAKDKSPEELAEDRAADADAHQKQADRKARKEDA